MAVSDRALRVAAALIAGVAAAAVTYLFYPDGATVRLLAAAMALVLGGSVGLGTVNFVIAGRSGRGDRSG